MITKRDFTAVQEWVTIIETQATELGIRQRIEVSLRISAATVADYEKVAKARIDLKISTCGELMSGVSRQSWDHRRAALLFMSARLYEKHLSEFQKAAADGDFDRAEIHAVKAWRALKVFRDVTSMKKPPARSKKKASKRRTLPKSEAWQQDAWNAATPVMRPAVAVCAVGARPAEVETGIEIKRVVRDGEPVICVTITGAKVRENEDHEVGQPWRKLYIAIDSCEGAMLDAAIPAGHDHVVVKRSAKRIGKDWDDRIRPAIGGKVSAYSLRHQFASNLKAAGFDRITIAKAMGHISTKSQSRYGSGKQGQGGMACLVAADAAKDVRCHTLPAFLDKNVTELRV